MTPEQIADSRIAECGITISSCGGKCPVEIEGEFDGLVFYFRARGSRWQFHVAKTQGDIFDRDICFIERAYGAGPFEAGWMDLHEAKGFVCDAVAAVRAILKEKM